MPPAAQTFSARAVAEHDSEEKGVWFIFESGVFDASSFLRYHPGGADLLLKYAGQDVSEVIAGKNPVHLHTDTALRILADRKVGMLDTFKGESPPHQLLRDRLMAKFGVDIEKAMFSQIGQLGGNYIDFMEYLEKNDESSVTARFSQGKSKLREQYGSFFPFYDEFIGSSLPGTFRMFENPVLEKLSRCPWYAAPLVWIPMVCLYMWYALTRLEVPSQLAWSVFTFSFFSWPFVEYVLHRWIFHMPRWLFNAAPWMTTVHFLAHGLHHLFPMDPGRLIMPPVLTAAITVFVFSCLRTLFSLPISVVIVAGTTLGYVVYDVTHFALHHGDWRAVPYLGFMKSYHLRHHYTDHDMSFGISTTLWDRLFGTYPNLKKKS